MAGEKPINPSSTQKIESVRDHKDTTSDIRFERRISRISTDLALNTISGVYAVKEKIAEGGQSEIFRAYDRSLKREVAIKRLRLLPESPEKQSKSFNDFIIEARLSAQLEHPAIVPLYGLFCGDAPEELNLAMKLLRGQTMQERLEMTRNIYEVKKNALAMEEAAFEERLRVFYRILKVIEYAHSRGVIHCDLKPQNLMLGDYDELYVMDWGIAYFYDPEKPGDPADRPPVGTPAYLAPELRRDALPSPRTDIFSLGVILFELVTLRPAIPGDSTEEILFNVENGHFAEFKHLLPGFKLSRDLEAIVRKATALEPDDRYQTVAEMNNDILRYRYGREVSARPDTLPRAIGRYVKRQYLLLLAIFALMGAVGLGLGVFSLVREITHITNTARLEKIRSTIHSAALGRAQKFDRNFLYFGAELDALGEFAERMLTMAGELPTQKVYQQDDFSLYRQSPPDIIYSPYYKRPISMSEIAFKLAPGVTTAKVASTLQRLGHMKSFFSRAVKNLGPEYAEIAQDEKIIESGGTVTGIYIGSRDGVFGYFPGNRHFPPEYDPRRRPWYASGSTADLPRWGRSYLSPSGAGVVIPCARRLQNANGETIGVIGLEISHERIRSLLDTSRNGERKYLVNSEGLLVLDDQSKAGSVKLRNDGLVEPRRFALTRDLAGIIKESPAGGARVLDREYLVAVKLQSLDLYYVETIPLLKPAI